MSERNDGALEDQDSRYALMIAVLWLRNLYATGDQTVKEKMRFAMPDPDLGLDWLTEMMNDYIPDGYDRIPEG